MKMFLPETSSENEDFYNLGKDWQYETTVPNKFWLRIRYYQESINLWLDKEIDRAYEDQIAPRNRAVKIIVIIKKISFDPFCITNKVFSIGIRVNQPIRTVDIMLR